MIKYFVITNIIFNFAHKQCNCSLKCDYSGYIIAKIIIIMNIFHVLVIKNIDKNATKRQTI